MTVQDLITGALTDLQILQAGETPSSEDTALGLLRLNEFMDGNKLLSGLIYTMRRTVWTLGTSPSYTVGLLGTIDTDRPVSPADISTIGYFDTTQTPTLDRYVPLYTDDQYQAIPQKSLTSTYPTGFHYEATYGPNGWGTLRPYPIPTSPSLRGFLYARAPMAEFNAVTETIVLPPGYRRFFRTNLAIEMASAFGVPVPEQVARIARDSKRDIEAANTRLMELGSDPMLSRGRYDIVSDTSGW